MQDPRFESQPPPKKDSFCREMTHKENYVEHPKPKVIKVPK